MKCQIYNIRNIIINILMVYLLYIVCRLQFFLHNTTFFTLDIFSRDFLKIMQGGLRFDASAISYTNALYLFMLLFPLHYKENKMFHTVAKWYYLVVNILCVCMSFADSVYFKFSTHRVSGDVFREFANEKNVVSICITELIHNWYLIVFVSLLAFLLWRYYRPTYAEGVRLNLTSYYVIYSIVFPLVIMLSVFSIRGATWQAAMRPLAVSNAHEYVRQAIETNIVLNTPFSMIRTITRKAPQVPVFFENENELNRIYNPIHLPVEGGVRKNKNIVILIIEDLSREFVGSLNPTLEGGNYKGYTPFIDSLLTKSLTYRNTFSNGVTSIDGMPSVLSSIPHGKYPFILSTYSLNRVNSIASELKNWGYYSAFFHGAMNGSMGFEAYANQAGFDHYFGRTEYNEDKRFDGDKDFDGTWAIWDEEYLQHYCLKMNEMHQPFITSVFTATSHHPYTIPNRYKNVFQEESEPIYRSIRYTDYALKHFFETASQQSWYKNTIFVLTADHANPYCFHDEYRVGIGHCKVPILIFDPSGNIKPEVREGIMQQIDIMPSLLGYLGYNRPFVAFGRNIFAEENSQGWATNYHSTGQYIYGQYYMEMTLEGNVTSLYNYETDPLFHNNLANTSHPMQDTMELRYKAYLQSYYNRMSTNRLTVEK